MLIVRMLIGIYIINLGYGFEGTGSRLGTFRFVSTALSVTDDNEDTPPEGGNRFKDQWWASIPVPLPKNYLLGIDLQKRDFERYHHPSYLGGEFRDKGWWYYYLYALVIKIPLGTWFLIGLAATQTIWRRRISIATLSSRGRESTTWQDEFILLAPAFIILTFVSSQTAFSEHLRYVLPIFPFFFVWIGRVAVAFDGGSASEPSGTVVGIEAQQANPSFARHTGAWRRRLFGRLVVASLTWSIMSSLSVYPHSLSYFNELVGGPLGGPKHLLNSNVDWGQDLLLLKKWLDRHPEARSLRLAYFGYIDPKYAGIKYVAPEVPKVRHGQTLDDAPIPPGWYAISVNFVQGLPYFSYKGDGTKISYTLGELARFQRLKPIAMAGYSIYIYHVE